MPDLDPIKMLKKSARAGKKVEVQAEAKKRTSDLRSTLTSACLAH